MSTRPTRRSLIGSYRYAVVIKPQENVFSESMTGSLDMYDGKHVIESHKFSSFDQLANTIISFWEQKLGSEVNVHRFSNWLSEYFSDIGITNINFYQLIETVRNLGRGVSLQSSGLEIRETKVIAQSLETPAERGVPDILAEISTPEAAAKNQLRKPSEMFKEEETISPKVTTLPPTKEEKEEEEELPPDDTLLKPSEVLKKRETIVMIEDRPSQAMGVTGDPVVTKASPKIIKEPPPSENLLRPSEYLKKRETIDVIFGSPTKPSQIQEQKKTKSAQQTSAKQRKLAPPSEKLLRPSEYLKLRREIEEFQIEQQKQKSDAVEKQTDTLLQTLLKPPRRIDIEKHEIPAPPTTKAKSKPVKAKQPPKKKESELPFEIEIAEDEKPVAKPKPSVKKRTPTPVTKTEPLVKELPLEITKIMGIGDKTAMLLKEGGFDTIEKIINAKPEELSKVRGIGIATAKKLISNAKTHAPKPPATVKKPVAKPAAKKPVVKEPVVKEPVVKEPVVKEPVVKEPVVKEPVVKEPVVKEPVVKEPVVKEKAPLQISDIMGVGEKTVMLLKEGGIDDLEKLVNSDPEELSKVRGIGITNAKKLIYGAKALKLKENDGR